MKNFFLITLAIVFLCSVCVDGSFAMQGDNPNIIQPNTTDKASEKASSDDKKIQFSWQKAEWEEVIEWIADQAGFSLQPVSDYPDGTFTLMDDSEYTVLEALDQINHALLIRPDEPFTLIRNRDMLVLWKTRDANFPNDLIETVKVEDLDKRGKYETISCIFDVGELDVEDIYGQLRPMISDIHRDYFVAFPAANQLHVRETGGQLRDIRDLLKASQSRIAGQEINIKPYRLKHQDADSFLLLARPLLGIEADQNSRPDENLSISVDPFGDRMFIRGTQKMLAEFDKVAAMVDAAPEELSGDTVLAEPYLKPYPVFTDPELALNILDTMLEGLDVKMDQDEKTGAISVLARADVHKKVKEYLDALSQVESDNFAIIFLRQADPAEVIVILQNMFRQTSEETATGPVLMAQSDLKQILVRGTPQEVATVKKMVQSLDENAVVPVTGPRTGHRMIDMSEGEQQEIMPMLQDLLGINGRYNKLNVVLPEDRKDIRSRIRTAPLEETPSLLEIPESSNRRTPLNNSRLLNKKSSQWNARVGESIVVLSSALGLNSIAVSGWVSPWQDQVGSTSDEVTRDKKSSEYRPAQQLPSVSGAPIEVRFTRYGIVLDSQDFDALDDLEDEIYRRLDAESTAQGPQFFALNYRSADEMLAFLETYYGLGDSGGGGGAGGMMQGMMNNMMGGGAGDLLGGLLGGSGGGTEGGILEGDVQFGVDMPFNMVWVRGATGNDLEEISAVIDTLDQPEPPHNPELIGDFYTIDVIHRDPTQLKEIIEIDMAGLLDTGEKAQGAGQNQEAAQMMKMMQQLAGGGKGRGAGGGSADYEKSKPKGKLGVDPTTKKLLVTGPRFIYQQVLKRVQLLDQADLSTPPIYELMTDVGDIDAQIQILLAMFGDKIEVIDKSTGEAQTANAAGATQANTTTAADKSDAEKARNEQIKTLFSNAARAQGGQAIPGAGGGGGARGARGGGGTRGGGGGGTRGGGGGRR